MDPKCRATRRDGSPCQAPPHTIDASGHCWAHSPTNAAARAEARRRGGKGASNAARAEKLVPASLRPLLATLLDAVGEVKAGALAPGQASAMAALASAVVRVYQVGMLEERVNELEAQHARQGKSA